MNDYFFVILGTLFYLSLIVALWITVLASDAVGWREWALGGITITLISKIHDLWKLL